MRAVLVVLSLSLSLLACARPNTVQCGDVTCPEGTHCGTSHPCIPDACGNEEIDAPEQCDGNDSIDHETLRCTDFGFYRGEPLTCTETCTIDTSQCKETCGDFEINGTERCDGIPQTGFACADFGFDVGPIGCSSSCTPAFDFCSNIGWQLVPGGASNELFAVHLAAPAAGVAVGRAGTIIAAKDGVWLPVAQTETTEDLNGIFGDGSTIIAVGNGGTILRFNGTSVTKMTSPTPNHLRDVDGGALGAIAVGDTGTILRFDGTTWSTMTSPTTENLHGVHVVSPASVYAVGANGTVLHFNGASWTKLTLPAVPAVTLFSVFAIGNAVFISGASSTVVGLDTDDNSVTVPAIPFDVPTDVDLRTVLAASPTDAYVAGGNGVMLHWNGTYLTAHDTPTNRTIFGLAAFDERIVGVTRGGSVIAFTGSSRHVSQPPLSEELYAVYTDATHVVAAGRDIVTLGPDGNWIVTAFTPEANSVFAIGDDVYIGAGADGLHKSTAGGVPSQVSTRGVNAVWATSSPFRVVTVGDDVIESTDGTTFPTTSSTTVHGTNTLRGVWASPDGVWYAVGEGGVAIRRAPGAAWTAIPTGVANRLNAVWGTASDDVFAAGTLGTILHWNGTGWRPMYTGITENLVSISGTSHGDVIAVGTSFTRLHYDGISWSRMASYNLDTPSVSTYRGTTFYVAGRNIERSDRVMTAKETRCEDPFDNDGTEGTNCEDDDCKLAPQCLRGGACETLERVTCDTNASVSGALATSTYSGVARITDLPCLDHPTPGPEASYRYVATQSGPVTVTIANATQSLDLVVTEAMDGHCLLETCQPATASGTTQTLTFTATAGRMYYIVVDGPVGTAATFDLSIDCG
jgi:hypothetical protein